MSASWPQYYARSVEIMFNLKPWRIVVAPSYDPPRIRRSPRDCYLYRAGFCWWEALS